jgi:hypothetical protein
VPDGNNGAKVNVPPILRTLASSLIGKAVATF